MTAYHLTSRRMQISEYLNLNAHLNTCRKMQLERVGHARCVVPKEKRFWWQNSLMGCLLKLLSLFLFETSLCVFWLLSHLSILKNLDPDACCWVLLASATCSTCSQKKKPKRAAVAGVYGLWITHCELQLSERRMREYLSCSLGRRLQHM